MNTLRIHSTHKPAHPMAISALVWGVNNRNEESCQRSLSISAQVSSRRRTTTPLQKLCSKWGRKKPHNQTTTTTMTVGSWMTEKLLYLPIDINWTRRKTWNSSRASYILLGLYFYCTFVDSYKVSEANSSLQAKVYDCNFPTDGWPDDQVVLWKMDNLNCIPDRWRRCLPG